MLEVTVESGEAAGMPLQPAAVAQPGVIPAQIAQSAGGSAAVELPDRDVIVADSDAQQAEAESARPPEHPEAPQAAGGGSGTTAETTASGRASHSDADGAAIASGQRQGSCSDDRGIAAYETNKRWWQDLKVDSRRRHCQAVCLRQFQCRSRRKRGMYRWSCRDSMMPCGPEGAAVWLSLFRLFTAAVIIAVGIVWSWVQYNGSGSVNTLGYRFATLTGWGLVISALYFLAAGTGFWLAVLAAGRCRVAVADAFTCGRSRKRRLAAAQAVGRVERPWWAPEAWAATVLPVTGSGAASIAVTGAAKGTSPPSLAGAHAKSGPEIAHGTDQPIQSLALPPLVPVDVESKAGVQPATGTLVFGGAEPAAAPVSPAPQGHLEAAEGGGKNVKTGPVQLQPPQAEAPSLRTNLSAISAGGSMPLSLLRLPPPTTLFDPHDPEWSMDNYPRIIIIPESLKPQAPTGGPATGTAANLNGTVSSSGHHAGDASGKHSMLGRRAHMCRALQRIDSGWRGAVILLWAFALPLEFVITLLFWAAGIALGAGSDLSGRPADQVASSVFQHIVLAPLLIDLACNRVPILPAHAVYLSLLFLAYIVTNVLYTTLVDAPPVYSNITWTNATSYYVTVIGFLLLYAAFALAWAVTRAKRACCGYGDARRRLGAGEVGRRELDASTGAVMEAGRHTVLVTVAVPRKPEGQPQAQSQSGHVALPLEAHAAGSGAAAVADTGRGRRGRPRPHSFEGGRGEL